MKNNRIATYIITYPGGGTHLLNDTLHTLGVPESDISMLIYHLVIAKKTDIKLDTYKSKTSNWQLFVELFNALPEKLDSNECYDNFFSIAVRHVCEKNFEYAYMCHPHASYKELKTDYLGGLIVDWSDSDISVFNYLLREVFNRAGYVYQEIAYCRNPIDLIMSRKPRLENSRAGYDIDKEIEGLSAFCQYLKNNSLEIYKYEDLCESPRSFLQRINQKLTGASCDVEKVLDTIEYSTAGINKNYGLPSKQKIEVLAKTTTLLTQLGYREPIKANYFERLRKDIALIRWEILQINKQLLKNDSSNDAAMARHKKTYIARGYLLILRLISSTARKNYYSRILNKI